MSLLVINIQLNKLGRDLVKIKIFHFIAINNYQRADIIKIR